MKNFDEEPTQLHFICQGTISVFVKRVRQKKAGESKGSILSAVLDFSVSKSDIILLNMYQPGQSVGDPELNLTTPLSSKVVVTQNDTKVVSLSRESFYRVFENKLNSIVMDRK